LPVPRITLASELNNHTSTAPLKMTWEYIFAAASEPPLPPIAA
jgi:hypothetical protein